MRVYDLGKPAGGQRGLWRPDPARSRIREHRAGRKVCLMGRNGTGKTTLLRVISGEVMADSGEVRRRQETLVTSLPQQVPGELRGNVFDVVAGGLDRTAGLLTEYHRR